MKPRGAIAEGCENDFDPVVLKRCEPCHYGGALYWGKRSSKARCPECSIDPHGRHTGHTWYIA